MRVQQRKRHYVQGLTVMASMRGPSGLSLRASDGGKAAPLEMEETINRLASSPLRGIVDHHLVKDGKGYHALIYLHYRGLEFNRQAFLTELIRIDPTSRATSVDMVSEQLTDTVRRRALSRHSWSGGVLVLFLLLVHFLETPSRCVLFPVSGPGRIGLHAGDHGSDRYAAQLHERHGAGDHPGDGE